MLTMLPETATREEIRSQPYVWTSVLADESRIRAAAHFVRGAGTASAAVVGCGSSFYLAQVASAAFNRAGLPALALPASEALQSWALHVASPQTMLVALSRSGETTEVLWAVEAHRAASRGPVLAITCEADSGLAAAADHTIVVHEGSEQSVVMTRSFSSMLLAAILLARELEGRPNAYAQLPGLCQTTIDAADALYADKGVASAGRQIFILGSGFAYGVAREGALKALEVSLSPAQAFHHLEFRHGPTSLVDDEALVVSLATPEAATREPGLLHELEGLGATVLRVGSGPRSPLCVPVQSSGDAALDALLALPALQLLALHRAARRGIDPDSPRHLDAVVRLAGDANGHSGSSADPLASQAQLGGGSGD
jgi:glucosamine--fructose-6-phosphate aminotransferase (isomerizing)